MLGGKSNTCSGRLRPGLIQHGRPGRGPMGVEQLRPDVNQRGWHPPGAPKVASPRSSRWRSCVTLRPRLRPGRMSARRRHSLHQTMRHASPAQGPSLRLRLDAIRSASNMRPLLLTPCPLKHKRYSGRPGPWKYNHAAESLDQRSVLAKPLSAVWAAGQEVRYRSKITWRGCLGDLHATGDGIRPTLPMLGPMSANFRGCCCELVHV